MLRLLHVETDYHPGCFKMMPSNTDTSTCRGCFILENIRFSLLHNETITSWVCYGLRPFHTQAIIYWGFFVLEPWYAEASLCWGCFNAGSFYIEVIKCWDSLIPEFISRWGYKATMILGCFTPANFKLRSFLAKLNFFWIHFIPKLLDAEASLC